MDDIGAEVSKKIRVSFLMIIVMRINFILSLNV